MLHKEILHLKHVHHASVPSGWSFYHHPVFHMPDSYSFVVLCLLLGFLAIWIWTLIDCYTSEALHGNTKVLWFVLLILFPIPGIIGYLILERRPHVHQPAQKHSTQLFYQPAQTYKAGYRQTEQKPRVDSASPTIWQGYEVPWASYPEPIQE
ncbi:PLD nuclease N-terminal domain-containing protein [Tengunoibacter tsumagoiensis]|uniref:Cardiolipin synthase N-terminal domain-containing protein n=1 Tax=Tengunoibacter tsumagoiensis TaxID=2014871 RepID=A0A402AAW6_9CHLR|nr:PLD nuclease N-terminal domain-containing protein [Tengunoibacter tsumagoiensis]GCE16081.1 hypothetical protein KTT_59400 [Tengunoibacter tsumagoiensis]